MGLANQAHHFRIGLALSSGGAAGLAHIGVLEEIQQAGIEIDCIAGTSAGAMVAAAFAAEQLDNFRDYMLSLTRPRVWRLFDPVWRRPGLLGGRRAMDVLRPYVGCRIEDLPRRFAAVATDLISGERVVLDGGDVIDAIRASVAIPLILTPQVLGERLLVDGALVDPLPVVAARELGADFVVAVNVIPSVNAPNCRLSAQWPRSTPFARAIGRLRAYWETPAQRAAAEAALTIFGASQASTLTGVFARSSAIVQANLAAARWREAPADFLIDPPVDDVGIFDFDRAKETIEAGRQAARAVLPALLEQIDAARESAASFATRASRLFRASRHAQQAA